MAPRRAIRFAFPLLLTPERTSPLPSAPRKAIGKAGLPIAPGIARRTENLALVLKLTASARVRIVSIHRHFRRFGGNFILAQ